VVYVTCLQINAWFLENRDPETGEYPDFPDDTDAGSKVILNPPLPPPPPAPAADGKKGAKKAPEKPKGKGKGKGKHYHSLLVHAVLQRCYCCVTAFVNLPVRVVSNKSGPARCGGRLFIMSACHLWLNSPPTTTQQAKCPAASWGMTHHRTAQHSTAQHSTAHHSELL